jgi:hypothetical protein
MAAQSAMLGSEHFDILAAGEQSYTPHKIAAST